MLIFICIYDKVKTITLSSQMAPESPWGREMALLEEIL